MKVISNKNLPVRLPISTTIVAIMALDYWNANQFLYGGVLTILAIGWIAAIYGICKQKQTDIFDKQDKN